MIDAEDAFVADGRGRHALAVLLAAAEPEPPLRLRAGARGAAEAAHALELLQVPRRLRQHRRGLGARMGGSRGRPGRGARAARSLARRADSLTRRGGTRGVRELAHRRCRTRVRVVRGRRLELVHPALTPTLLGRRPGRVALALVRARPGPTRRGSAHALPDRSPVARADRGPAKGRRTPSISRAGRRRPRPTRLFSPRSPSCAVWSSSDARPARRRA